MTDPFEAVAGHTQALDQLRSQVRTDRLAHAYLFVGESGLGKAMTARALASALLPEAPLTRHPDYWEDDRIKPLSINEIRLLPDKPPEFHELSLQAFLNLKPAIGGGGAGGWRMAGGAGARARADWSKPLGSRPLLPVSGWRRRASIPSFGRPPVFWAS